MNKKNIIWVVAGIIVLVGVFYGGVSYGKGQAMAARTAAFQNGGARNRGGAGGFGGLTIGSILSKDAQSITLSLNGGGSKIVFYNNQTSVSKTVSGTMADLAVGQEVSVMGTANSDGSVTAQAVQIRPAMAARPSATSPATTTTQ